MAHHEGELMTSVFSRLTLMEQKVKQQQVDLRKKDLEISDLKRQLKLYKLESATSSEGDKAILQAKVSAFFLRIYFLISLPLRTIIKKKKKKKNCPSWKQTGTKHQTAKENLGNGKLFERL